MRLKSIKIKLKSRSSSTIQQPKQTVKGNQKSIHIYTIQKQAKDND